MTPAEEASFIALWEQGASYREIAAALGCSLGTVASRAAALAAQGKITPRPRGGAYPRRRAKARPEDPPSTVHRGPSTVHGPPSAGGPHRRLDRCPAAGPRPPGRPGDGAGATTPGGSSTVHRPP
jgi:DNA-binding transcriptional MocR family regulator